MRFPVCSVGLLLFRCIPHPFAEVLYVSFYRLHKEERLTRRKSIAASLETPYSLSKGTPRRRRTAFRGEEGKQGRNERNEKRSSVSLQLPPRSWGCPFTTATWTASNFFQITLFFLHATVTPSRLQLRNVFYTVNTIMHIITFFFHKHQGESHSVIRTQKMFSLYVLFWGRPKVRWFTKTN